MTGHEHIIAMRRKGVRPVVAYLFDFPVCREARQEDAVILSADDRPDRLDLRFLVGLNVVIHSDSAERAAAFYAAAKKAGAARVISAVPNGFDITVTDTAEEACA